jgi:hypothetical protein
MSEIINESSDLVKTYVPNFDEFISDPDKYLSELPGYDGVQTDENPEAQTSEFEAAGGDGDVSVDDGGQIQGQGDSAGAGDAWGEAPTGGEFGGDTSTAGTDEFTSQGDVQTQSQDDLGGQTQTQGQGDETSTQTQGEDFGTEDTDVVEEDTTQTEETSTDETEVVEEDTF